MKEVKFLNLKINVSKKVFKPRIETEFWVKKAIKDLKKIKKPLQILDIFAGTGCIGISILKNIKDSQVDFVDISKEAIEQMKINLKLNKISQKKYRVYKSNLFEKLKGKKYDFIFANPPYVALNRILEVQKEVLKKEPYLALFAGKDGTVYVKKFFNQVKKHLKPKGKIFLELDPLQKERIKEVLKKENFKFLFKKDQFEKYRWLEARG